MAVEAFAKPNMMDDMDEDEGPLVFKRNSKQNQLNSSQKIERSPRVTVAESRPLKQNQSNSQAKKITSQKLEGQSGIKGSESRPLKQNQQNSEAKKTTSLVSESRPLEQNQSNSEAKNVTSQKLEGKPRNLASGFGSLNGQNSSLQKGKMVHCSKSSPVKSPLTSPKASSLSANTSPVVNSRASSSVSDQPKNAAQRDVRTVFERQKPFIESSYAPNSDSEDSEDNKPLSARLPAGVPKGNSNNIKKGSNTSNLSSGSVPKTGVKHENSDDEMPLSSKFLKSNAGTSATKSNVSDQQKALSSKLDPSKPLSKSSVRSNAGVSVNKYDDSDEEKPLSSKLQQNGSATRDGQLKKSSATVNKRPISDVKSTDPSSVKKPKLSDASTPTGFKKESVKEETRDDGDDDDDDDDHVPISQRMKKSATPVNKSTSAKPKVTKVISSSLKTSQTSKKVIKKSKYSKPSKVPPGSGEGQKWTTLIHNGVIFPPPYKPHGVKMLYKGKPIDLTPEQEEVATMYAVMLDTDYMNKPKFKENFMTDWRKILGKNHVIQKLEDCDFTPIYEWHQKEKEMKKQMSTEEKKALKDEKLKQEDKYMWAIVDGVKEKVGNFRVEPPGLFRGRGEHPKMGKLKKRIRPSDITINIGKGAPIPECPIPGESWKEIRHDDTVTWLAFWNDPINPKEFKYVFLAASSSLKGQSDKEKYEKARLLKDYIRGIRAAYTKNFTSKDITKQQIAVATYLIDKLALRAGNEKDDDEADTVGCCTLKVENVEPIPPNILKFDFLGKDSIRYQNEVEVELAVFKAIQKFRTGKRGSDDLFDMLDTSKLNAHLKELMPGLTAKVFRTYNASITLDDMLSRETKGGDVTEKVVVYQHANKEVAIICNHQRSVSKSHSAQMLRLDEKIEELKRALEVLKTDLARAKKGKPPLKSTDGKPKRNLSPEVLERKIAQANVRLEKAERDKETKEDLKTVALGTSKINYLDPRITVAWCKRHEVPIEKIFNKSLLAKFAWAMDVDPGFRF